MSPTHKKLIGTSAFVVLTGVFAFTNAGFVQEAFSKAAVNRAEVVAQQGNGYGQECSPLNTGKSVVVSVGREGFAVERSGTGIITSYVIGGRTQYKNIAGFSELEAGMFVEIVGQKCTNRLHPLALKVNVIPGQNK